MSNRKRIKPPIPTTAETVDMMASDFAKHMFDKQVREHEAELRRESERQAVRLTDNDYAASFGLPTDLPEFAREILGHTMAMDRLGESRPKRDKVYNRYGVH